MAMHQVTETFDRISTSKWSNWGGAQCTAVNGQLNVATTTAASFFGIEAYDLQDLTGSYAMIELVNAGNQSLPNFQAVPIELIISTLANALMFVIQAGTIYARSIVASTPTDLGSATYSSVTHRFLRIRESEGTCYWEYSSDQNTWTVLGSVATPFAITLLRYNIVAGNTAIEGSGTTMIVDNVNIMLGRGMIKNPNIRPYPFSPCRAR